MRKIIQTAALAFCLVLPFWAQADEAELEQFVEQVISIDTDQARLQLGDRSLNYTNFTIVQMYQGNPDQRLPLSAARKGTWVLIDAEYSLALKRYIARRLQLLPSEIVAKQLLDNL